MKAVRFRRLPMAVVMAAVFAAFAQPLAGAAVTGPADDAARGYAEALAQAASKEFGLIIERQRFAQAQQPKSDAGAAAKQDGETLAPLRWFQRSSREFQTLMKMLAEGVPPSHPWDPVADAEKKAALQKADRSPDQPPSKTAATRATAPDTRNAEEAKTDHAKSIADAKMAEDAKEAAEAKRASEAKAADEKKAADAKRAADAKAADGKKAAEAKRVADLKAVEDAKRAAVAKAAADAAKAAAQAKRVAAAKAAEQKKAAEAQAAIDAARAAEVKRAADAKAAVDAAKAADAKREAARAAAEARTAAAAKKVAEAKQVAGAKRLAEAKKGPVEAGQPAGAGKAPAPAASRHSQAARASCKDAGKTISAPGWYVVEEGDTLSAIAWRHYGAARCYPRIHAANRRRIRNPHLIYPCQRIYLPRPLRRR